MTIIVWLITVRIMTVKVVIATVIVIIIIIIVMGCDGASRGCHPLRREAVSTKKAAMAICIYNTNPCCGAGASCHNRARSANLVKQCKTRRTTEATSSLLSNEEEFLTVYPHQLHRTRLNVSETTSVA